MAPNARPDLASSDHQVPDHLLSTRGLGDPSRSWATYHGTKIVDGLPKKRIATTPTKSPGQD